MKSSQYKVREYREDFEERLPKHFDLRKNKEGDYINKQTQSAWFGFSMAFLDRDQKGSFMRYDRTIVIPHDNEGWPEATRRAKTHTVEKGERELLRVAQEHESAFGLYRLIKVYRGHLNDFDYKYCNERYYHYYNNHTNALYITDDFGNSVIPPLRQKQIFS